ncbi:hypothetical protein Mnod_7479 [Methylobacterium nodulans ORS 2060]|uniref:Uncharacterized protein n=1 Tax=Methylobacterium nodulans (strain LMG 21967 / CNCM I-2342 / ORS 2060) TaxID=460265 RepID=B8IPC4_METNO|nr:hypothetical protein Mnod_7479 [Methylobacterium nodulans ORS 2060]
MPLPYTVLFADLLRRERAPERFPPKWRPVRRRQCGKLKDLEQKPVHSEWILL